MIARLDGGTRLRHGDSAGHMASLHPDAEGNTNGEVEIYRYVTEGSFDAYMWQTLETKARFIEQVMSGQTSVRTAEDLEGGARASS